jgi:hypothetical protein
MEFVIKLTETTGNPHSRAFLVNGDDAVQALNNLLKKKHFRDFYSKVLGNLNIDIVHLNENYTLSEQQ